jgi:hypothetical protein
LPGEITENEHGSVDPPIGGPDWRATVPDRNLCAVSSEEYRVVWKFDDDSLSKGSRHRVFDRVPGVGVDEREDVRQ